MHIPTVASRHPLWDEHEEEADPDNRRVLADGKQVLATSSIDAIDGSIAQMPEESVLPLVTALLLLGLSLSLVFSELWWAGGFTLATLLSVAAWLWPESKEMTA
ncbi:hypothetical protein [Modicisalibacter luteus]|uniref:hypothetical protein n=1 Tax=Modicisalibacter luteus TaxID=453962 RepID=UPI003635C5BB